MKLPIEISPCPILEAIIEIRFIPSTHPNAVFGLIYNELKIDFPKVENLPILQLPEPLRMSDPNFKFKPHYKISNNSFSVQIGPDVLSISSLPKYSGWTKFSDVLFDIFTRVNKIQIIKNVTRIGIRYISFFQDDIFKKANISVCINQEKIEYKNTLVRTEILNVGFSNSLQIANNVKNSNRLGSIIDIDTHKESGLDEFFVNMRELLNSGHSIEKELFFSLLSKDLLESLNPRF